MLGRAHRGLKLHSSPPLTMVSVKKKKVNSYKSSLPPIQRVSELCNAAGGESTRWHMKGSRVEVRLVWVWKSPITHKLYDFGQISFSLRLLMRKVEPVIPFCRWVRTYICMLQYAWKILKKVIPFVSMARSTELVCFKYVLEKSGICINKHRRCWLLLLYCINKSLNNFTCLHVFSGTYYVPDVEKPLKCLVIPPLDFLGQELREWDSSFMTLDQELLDYRLYVL